MVDSLKRPARQEEEKVCWEHWGEMARLVDVEAATLERDGCRKGKGSDDQLTRLAAHTKLIFRISDPFDFHIWNRR